MKVAIYARVSTSDKEQNPDTQLLPLREFVEREAWEVYAEYQDQASASDLRHRNQWRQMVDDASKKRFDLVLVWRMDRAFRSVLDAANMLERLRAWGVGLRSYSEPWIDTTSAFGEALYYITIAYAQLEKGILRERVKAGMERAAIKGTKSGKPIGRESLKVTMPQIIDALKSAQSVSGAGRNLKVSRGYIIKKLKDAGLTSEGVIKGVENFTFKKG